MFRKRWGRWWMEREAPQVDELQSTLDWGEGQYEAQSLQDPRRQKRSEPERPPEAPRLGDDGRGRGHQGEATRSPGREERGPAGKGRRRPQECDTPTTEALLTCSSSGVSSGAMSAWGAVAGSIPPPPPANRTGPGALEPTLWPWCPRARAQQPGAGSRMVGRRARARGGRANAAAVCSRRALRAVALV